MADTKISALPASTLPLAGTEVLPIVQSSTTKKVAVDDLTVKNVRSNATSGILQIAGPAAAATRVMTTPDANFTVARTDAAQSFTGDQTLSTGNLIIGTAGQGIDFSADPAAAGMTSELLDDYEEGTWTPVLGGTTGQSGQTYTRQLGQYTKVGRKVTVTWDVICSNVGTMTGNAALRELPFTVGNNQGYRAGLSVGEFSGLATIVSIFSGITSENTTDLQIRTSATAATSVSSIAATSLWSNGTQFIGAITYFV
jgi:hypothetical protein